MVESVSESTRQHFAQYQEEKEEISSDIIEIQVNNPENDSMLDERQN